MSIIHGVGTNLAWRDHCLLWLPTSKTAVHEKYKRVDGPKPKHNLIARFCELSMYFGSFISFSIWILREYKSVYHHRFWNVLFDFVPRVFVSVCVCIKFDLPTGKQTITAASYYISWPVPAKRTLIALLLITYSNQPWPVVIITVTQWLLHCVSGLETVIQHCGTNRRFCHKLLSLMVSTRTRTPMIPARNYEPRHDVSFMQPLTGSHPFS